jgi:DNA polymerase-1
MKQLNSYEIDKKLEPALRDMEKCGVKLDFNYLAKINEKVGLELVELEEKAYKSLGHEFNLNSPSQLAHILYDELKINSQNSRIKKGKTHVSTSAQDLEKIRDKHPLVDIILQYRELAKLRNTYLEPLPKLIGADGRLHTTYAVDTATGRLSSKNPNLQNIPIRTDIGREVRKAFVAEDGYKLLASDYSQIELRIAAHLSNDANMIEIFKNGKDIHKATAEELGVDRRMAKVVNFSILYGVSAYGLGESLKIPTEEAQLLIDKYYVAFPKLKEYIDQTISETEESGMVMTMFGRTREIPELHSPNRQIRNFGERIAVNTPIQGTAAEIIKLAMISLAKKLKSQEANKLILQVHDELVFEVKNDMVNELAQLVRAEMENVIKLSVPLLVDIKVGDNWGELETII